VGFILSDGVDSIGRSTGAVGVIGQDYRLRRMGGPSAGLFDGGRFDDPILLPVQPSNA